MKTKDELLEEINERKRHIELQSTACEVKEI